VTDPNPGDDSHPTGPPEPASDADALDGQPPGLDLVWRSALAGLPDGALSPQHRAWLGLTRPLGLMEDTALLAAPNEFAKDVLDTRLRPLIAQALSAAYGRDIRVAVTVQPPPRAAIRNGMPPTSSRRPSASSPRSCTATIPG